MDCFLNERTVKLKFILLICWVSDVLFIWNDSALSTESLSSSLEESSEIESKICLAFFGFLLIFLVTFFEGFLTSFLSDWEPTGKFKEVLFLLRWGEHSGLDPETFLTCGCSYSLPRGAFSSRLRSPLSSPSLFLWTDMWRVNLAYCLSSLAKNSGLGFKNWSCVMLSLASSGFSNFSTLKKG